MIHVSHNEIITLCEKAFIACRRNCGEADNIAHMIADLEMAGLGGITLFADTLAFLQQENDEPIPISYHNQSQDGTATITGDLQGCSIVCHLPAILDYALEVLSTHHRVQVILQRCHNRWLAYGQLLSIANKGFSVQAHWSNGHAPYQIQYILNANQALPDIYLYDHPEGDPHTLTLLLQTVPHRVAPRHTHYQRHISRAKFSETLKQSWKEGVLVNPSDWMKIKTIARSILVESDDISHTRAGGQ